MFTNDLRPPRVFIRRNCDTFLPTRVMRGASIGANVTVVCGTTIGEYAFIARARSSSTMFRLMHWWSATLAKSSAKFASVARALMLGIFRRLQSSAQCEFGNASRAPAPTVAAQRNISSSIHLGQKNRLTNRRMQVRRIDHLAASPIGTTSLTWHPDWPVGAGSRSQPPWHPWPSLPWHANRQSWPKVVTREFLSKIL